MLWQDVVRPGSSLRTPIVGTTTKTGNALITIVYIALNVADIGETVRLRL